MLEPKTHLCLTTQKPYQPQPYVNCHGLPRPRSLPAVTFKGCDTGLRLLADTTVSLRQLKRKWLLPHAQAFDSPAHRSKAVSAGTKGCLLLPNSLKTVSNSLNQPSHSLFS